MTDIQLNLEGSYLYPVTRAIFYTCTAHRLKWATQQRANYIVKDQDMRTNFMFIMPPGSGKEDIASAIRQVVKAVEPTRLHPDHFIGKILIDSRGNETENRGYFAEEYLLLDEAFKIVESEQGDYSETRKYMKTALNPYPDRSVVTKGRVDAKKRLSYPCFATITLFLQPMPIAEEAVMSGFFRRFVPFYTEDIPETVNLPPPTTVVIPDQPQFRPLTDVAVRQVTRQVNRLLRALLEEYVDIKGIIIKGYRNDISYTAQRFAICNRAAGAPERRAVAWALFDATIFYRSVFEYITQYIKVSRVPMAVDAQLMRVLWYCWRAAQYGKTLTNERLAGKLGVSVRTVLRYKQALSVRGCPVA